MVRSRSRSPSGALVTSACNAEMARVRNWTACARVVSSTRVASRSPRLRGSLRPTPASACRAARTASMCHDGGPLGTADLNDPLAPGEQRRGESGPEAAGAFNGPQRRVLTLAEGHQLAVPGRIGGNRQVFQDRAGRADRRRSMRVLVGVDTDDDTKILMDSQRAVHSLS